jgi:hypothetical protein
MTHTSNTQQQTQTHFVTIRKALPPPLADCDLVHRHLQLRLLSFGCPCQVPIVGDLLKNVQGIEQTISHGEKPIFFMSKGSEYL